METQEYKSLKKIHAVFCIGTTTVLFVNHYIKKISFDNLSGEIDTPSLFIIGFGTVMAVLSVIIFNKTRGSDQQSKTDCIKLRKAYIIKWAVLEGAVLLSFTYYFYLNGHQLTLLSGFTLLILLVISSPKLVTHE